MDDMTASQHPIEPTPPWTPVLRLAAALTLLGAAVIHVTQIGIHLEEWAAAGGFFVFLAVGQGLLGLVLLRRGGWPQSWAAVAVSLLAIATWVISRTTGLPFGPEADIAEPVQRPDLLATFFEAVTILALVLLLRFAPKHEGFAHLAGPAHVPVAAVFVSVAVLTTYAIQPVEGCGHHGVENEKLAQQDTHREESPGKRARHDGQDHEHRRSRDRAPHKAAESGDSHEPEKKADC